MIQRKITQFKKWPDLNKYFTKKHKTTKMQEKRYLTSLVIGKYQLSHYREYFTPLEGQKIKTDDTEEPK